MTPDGPSWILLRGLTRERAHWGDFPDRLRERLPARRIVALDLPGNGVHHALASPTRIDAMGAWCRAQLRAQGIAPPHALLAMSMGAMVALDWAQRAPSSLAGCVLINTSLRPFSPWHQRLRPQRIGSLLRIALLAASDVERERLILRMTSHHCADAAAVIATWARVRAERPVSRANALRQLWAAARYRAPAATPSVPLLVLASARDALVDVRCSQRLAERWGVPIAIHPSAGHDVPLDDAAWVIDQVARWSVDALSQNATGPRLAGIDHPERTFP